MISPPEHWKTFSRGKVCISPHVGLLLIYLVECRKLPISGIIDERKNNDTEEDDDDDTEQGRSRNVRSSTLQDSDSDWWPNQSKFGTPYDLVTIISVLKTLSACRIIVCVVWISEIVCMVVYSLWVNGRTREESDKL